MRLFVALQPPDEALAHLRDAMLDLGPGVRLSPPEQTHLTLAFLGEVEDPVPIAQALSGVVPGRPPLRLRLAGGGSFRGGAVWLGLEGDVAALKALAQDVDEALRSAGVVLEKRTWHPHVTVGRARIGGFPPPSLLSYAGPVAPWKQVALVRSHLLRGGARHEPLGHWELRAAVHQRAQEE